MKKFLNKFRNRYFIRVTNRSGFRRTIYYSRFLVERFIGRDLKINEIVHHIDGNQKNDILSNLYIFISRKAHGKYHGKKNPKKLVSNLYKFRDKCSR